jgi:hypothetical protein
MKRILFLAFLMSLFCSRTLKAEDEKQWSINVGGGYMATPSFIHLNVGIGSYDSETMGTFQIGYSYSF